jgi:carboxymethylenebutenolidase
MTVAPAYDEALTDPTRRIFESWLYAGAQHGFHNNTRPRYDALAANLAWQRTLDFFTQHLATHQAVVLL